MKKIILMILLLVLSCDAVTEDKDPYVVAELPDIEVVSNAADEVIPLQNVFTDDDNDDSEIILRLNDNSNPSVVTAVVDSNAKTLTLSFHEGFIGTSIVKVEAESNGKFVIDAFLVTVNEVPDVAPTVINAISDFIVFEGDPDSEIQLSNVFDDADGDAITLSVSSTNSSLLSSSITGTLLTLSYHEFETGSSNVTVTATANGKMVSDLFVVTVSQNQTLMHIEQGETEYDNGNFSLAEQHFVNSINQGDERYIELAYVGLSFSQMAQGTDKHQDAYDNMTLGYELSASDYENDFMAGFAFLDYTMNSDYASAILNAETVLENDPAWSMYFNDEINHLDLRLTLAQAYFDNQQFTEALLQVKILDNQFDLTEDDPNFLILLAEKLRALADLYRE